MSDEVVELEAAAPAPLMDPRTVPVRYHHLRAFRLSPLHGRHVMERPESDVLKGSTLIGAAVHAKLLGGRPVETFTGGKRIGKAWDEFKAKHAGGIFPSPSESAAIDAMVAAVRAREVASRVLFAPGIEHERRIEWEWNGRACRSTPDAAGFRTLIEIKTTRSAEPRSFRRDFENHGYHGQLAYYRRAIEVTTGVRPRDVYVIAVENTPPHAVAVYRVTEQALDLGDRLVRTWFESLVAAEQAGHWSGYGDAVIDLDLADREDLAITVGGEEVEL